VGGLTELAEKVTGKVVDAIGISPEQIKEDIEDGLGEVTSRLDAMHETLKEIKELLSESLARPVAKSRR
jgi:hypothetical protein